MPVRFTYHTCCLLVKIRQSVQSHVAFLNHGMAVYMWAQTATHRALIKLFCCLFVKIHTYVRISVGSKSCFFFSELKVPVATPPTKLPDTAASQQMKQSLRHKLQQESYKKAILQLPGVDIPSLVATASQIPTTPEIIQEAFKNVCVCARARVCVCVCVCVYQNSKLNKTTLLMTHNMYLNIRTYVQYKLAVAICTICIYGYVCMCDLKHFYCTVYTHTSVAVYT